MSIMSTFTLNNPKWTDAVVICDGIPFKVHRMIICPKSPWFDDHCAEAGVPVTVPDAVGSSNTLERVLRFMYEGILGDDNACSIPSAAKHQNSLDSLCLTSSEETLADTSPYGGSVDSVCSSMESLTLKSGPVVPHQFREVFSDASIHSASLALEVASLTELTQAKLSASIDSAFQNSESGLGDFLLIILDLTERGRMSLEILTALTEKCIADIKTLILSTDFLDSLKRLPYLALHLLQALVHNADTRLLATPKQHNADVKSCKIIDELKDAHKQALKRATGEIERLRTELRSLPAPGSTASSQTSDSDATRKLNSQTAYIKSLEQQTNDLRKANDELFERNRMLAGAGPQPENTPDLEREYNNLKREFANFKKNGQATIDDLYSKNAGLLQELKPYRAGAGSAAAAAPPDARNPDYWKSKLRAQETENVSLRQRIADQERAVITAAVRQSNSVEPPSPTTAASTSSLYERMRVMRNKVDAPKTRNSASSSPAVPTVALPTATVAAPDGTTAAMQKLQRRNRMLETNNKFIFNEKRLLVDQIGQLQTSLNLNRGGATGRFVSNPALGGSGAGAQASANMSVDRVRQAYNEALKVAGQEHISCNECLVPFNSQFRGAPESPDLRQLILQCKVCQAEAARWKV